MSLMEKVAYPMAKMKDGTQEINVKDIVTEGPWVDVRAFGAVLDGSTDDTIALQNAINYAQTNMKSLYIPKGTVHNGMLLISSEILISAPLIIFGDGKLKSVITSVATAGTIKITNRNVVLRDIGVSFYLVYPNAAASNTIGIHVQGSAESHLYSFFMDNVSVRGFQTAIKTEYVWDTVFDNVDTIDCQYGILNVGLSVNNQVSNCHLSAAGSGSACIEFTNTTDVTEGWMITNSLLASADYGIRARNTSHVLISNCIIDLIVSVGIENDYTGLNWQITNNYIALSGGGYGINFSACEDNWQDRGHKIIGNTILGYSGSSAVAGIRASGTICKEITIIGNSFSGFTVFDIWLDGTGSTANIIGNNCMSALPYNMYVLIPAKVMNNTGSVYRTEGLNVTWIEGNLLRTYHNGIPTSGTWKSGDLCWEQFPADNGCVGYICTTGGTPGTWQPFGISGMIQGAARADSAATDVAGVNAVLNDLLAKLRAAKIIAT